MAFTYQSCDSVTGHLYTWVSDSADPTGSGYPGPNSPTDILQTSVTPQPGGTVITASYVELDNYAAFRARGTPLDEGVVVRFKDSGKEYRNSLTTGAGFNDDGNTILKRSAVAVEDPERLYSIAASEHAATFAAARAMVGLAGHCKHVHIEAHTQSGDGGGGTFDIRTGDLGLDNNGTLIQCADGTWLKRRGWESTDVNARWFGAAGDLTFALTAPSGPYIDPDSIKGGEHDNAAIVAAAAFAGANKKELVIPAGVYLFDTTQLNFISGLSIRGVPGRTVIVSRINKPFVVGTMTTARYEVKIKDIEILCYEDHSSDPEDWVAVDLYATSKSVFDFAARGWDRHLKSVHENANVSLDVRGENYLSQFRFRQMNYNNGLPLPPRSDVVCHIEGQVNGSTFTSEAESPLTSALILKGGLRGALGSTITIEDVNVDNCTDGVIVEDGGGINVRRLYGEGCINALLISNCTGVSITNVRGGDTWVIDCQGADFGESVSRLHNVRSQVINRGATYGQAPKSIASTNVGILALGHNFDVGPDNRCPLTSHSQLDGRNLFCNGDFSRWTGGDPWLWRNAVYYSSTFTKCGTGLANTTKSAAVPYCCRVEGPTSGEFYVTPPLGDQYLSTTVAISVKVKYVSGIALLTVKGNDPATLNTEVGRNVADSDGSWIECLDEAGDTDWRLVTFMWVIDQDICDKGIALQMQAYSGCDIYLSELQLNFGVACPRVFIPAREILGGTVGVSRNGTIELASAALPTITTDPITSQALVAGDRAVDATGATEGWRYNGEVWEPLGQSDESNLVEQIRRVDSSNKIAMLLLGADFTGTGPWRARIGADLPSLGAAQAAVGTIRNRKAAVFAAGATTMGYALPVNCAEYWAVARFDLGGNFANLESMVGGAGSGPRLVGATGTANLINDCTITRDNVSSVAVDGTTRIWRATDTAAADTRALGSYDLAVNTNWVGPIGLAMAVTTAFTAEEADAIYNLIRNYFAK